MWNTSLLTQIVQNDIINIEHNLVKKTSKIKYNVSL